MNISNSKAKMTTFFSAKGGSGQTIISSNCALLCSEKTSTIFLQFTCYPDADTFFGIKPKSNFIHIIDFIKNGEEINKTFSELCYTINNLAILLSPDNSTILKKINSNEIISLIKILTSKFDRIIIDLSKDFPFTKEILDLTDKIIIVTNIDPQSLRQTNSLLKKLENEHNNKHTHVVLNQVPKTITRNSIQKYIQGNITTLLPYDMEGAWDNAAMQMPYTRTHSKLSKRTHEFVNSTIL